MDEPPVLPPPNPADRFVLVDMLLATAKSLGWVPLSADTKASRVVVTFVPRES
jgi:hypothetical protein